MVNVVKKKVAKGLRREAWERFWNALSRSHSEKALVENLRSFLTAAEITMLEKRLLIPILLGRKMSYRRIGQLIDVSPMTIIFVKRNLQKRPAARRTYASLYERKEDSLPLLPPRSGYGRWIRERQRRGHLPQY